MSIFPFFRFKIAGHSMEPLHKDGDHILINRLAYLFNKPKLGDTVAIKPGKQRGQLLLKKIEKVLPENKYFVVGTNLADSYDSRTFGPVSKKSILGRVWFNY